MSKPGPKEQAISQARQAEAEMASAEREPAPEEEALLHAPGLSRGDHFTVFREEDAGSEFRVTDLETINIGEPPIIHAVDGAGASRFFRLAEVMEVTKMAAIKGKVNGTAKKAEKTKPPKKHDLDGKITVRMIAEKAGTDGDHIRPIIRKLRGSAAPVGQGGRYAWDSWDDEEIVKILAELSGNGEKKEAPKKAPKAKQAKAEKPEEAPEAPEVPDAPKPAEEPEEEATEATSEEVASEDQAEVPKPPRTPRKKATAKKATAGSGTTRTTRKTPVKA